MYTATKISILLLALLISHSLSEDEEDKPFRANKLNMIWQKLQNKMSANKLQDLKRALSDQDQKEMNWKELKLHGGDADGEIEAGLRRSLFKILEYYGHEKLVGKVPEPAEPRVEDNSVRGEDDFTDSRLKHLWKLAKKHGMLITIHIAQGSGARMIKTCQYKFFSSQNFREHR